MTISPKGVAFVEREEGFVSRAYRCPAGVLTIGSGFTNRSKAVREVLGTIQPGSTITREQNARLLAHAFAVEYGPPVDRAMPGAAQHELDAGYSLSFNCGPGAAGWTWAKLWRAGLKGEAATKLRATATTGGGKRLKGLVDRRAREAALLDRGDYGRLATSVSGSGAPAPSVPAGQDGADTVKAYQERLKTLGYDPGPIDGLIGPRTRVAVFSFQVRHPQLRADGILGRATMAAVDRATAARTRAVQVATVAAAPPATAGAVKVHGADLGDMGVASLGVALALAGAAAGRSAWQYRDELAQALAPTTDPSETTKGAAMLKGKKTYIVAGLGAIYAITGVLSGNMDLNEAVRFLMESGAFATLRAGVAGTVAALNAE